MNEIITNLRNRLREASNEIIRESSTRFFKEEIKVYGIKTSDVIKLAKEGFSRIKHLSKPEIFELCEQLWQSGYMEESFVACNWSYAISEKFEPSDFVSFHLWVAKYVSNWASCDTLCNHTIGKFIEMYPDSICELKKWAKSNNRWVKRASAVTLIIPARKGLFLNDIFEIADILLLDKDDLVQKGYGWMLKAASQSHQQEVFEYVMSKKSVMPRTALRYAIEIMPLKMKEDVMKK